MTQKENHRLENTGWLRAAVLGANDGAISISSLVVGVAAGGAHWHAMMLSGLAGLCAGAFSMAAGEYVSVKSQSDTEKAELERERLELEQQPEVELEELTSIYQSRGLDQDLARTVARQLTQRDALKAHLRDELGITEFSKARPVQAAAASALAFTVGGAVPLICAVLIPESRLSYGIPAATLVTLAILGGLAAKVGGAPPIIGAVRVVFWGAVAMFFSGIVGSLFGATI